MEYLLNNLDLKRRELPSDKKEQGKTLIFLQVSNFVEKKGHEFTVKAFYEFLKYYKKIVSCILVVMVQGVNSNYWDVQGVRYNK